MNLNIPKLGVHPYRGPRPPKHNGGNDPSPFSTGIPFRRFMLRLLALRESTRMLHPFLGAPKVASPEVGGWPWPWPR